MKPIRPEDVTNEKQNDIPDFVFEAFNNLIKKNWTGKYASIKQDDVIDEILRLAGGDAREGFGFDRQYIFKMRYLDVEDIYRSYGWSVEYDKPAYNESYPASFEFKKS